MGRNISYGLLLWVFGCTVALVPLLIEARSFLNEWPVAAFFRLYDDHYKDLLIYVMVISGVGAGDAVYANRRSPERSRAGDFALFVFMLLFLIELVLVALFAYRLGASDTQIRSHWMVLAWCIGLSWVAKVLAEWSRASTDQPADA